MVYDLGPKPTKSQIFAQKIYLIAVNDRGFTIKAIPPVDLERLADEALRRFPILRPNVMHSPRYYHLQQVVRLKRKYRH